MLEYPGPILVFGQIHFHYRWLCQVSKKLKGSGEGSVNYVHKGFIYLKNVEIDSKNHLRCHRYREGCKGTAVIQKNKFRVYPKCLHKSELTEIKKRKIESDIKNTAGSTNLCLKKIYDERVPPKFSAQSFSKMKTTMMKRRMKDFNVCSVCRKNDVAHIVQPCGHMFCAFCVKFELCKLCGCQIKSHVTISFQKT